MFGLCNVEYLSFSGACRAFWLIGEPRTSGSAVVTLLIPASPILEETQRNLNWYAKPMFLSLRLFS